MPALLSSQLVSVYEMHDLLMQNFLLDLTTPYKTADAAETAVRQHNLYLVSSSDA